MKKLLLLFVVCMLTGIASAQNFVVIASGDSLHKFKAENLDSITIYPKGYYGLKNIDNLEFLNYYNDSQESSFITTIKFTPNDADKNAVELWNASGELDSQGFMAKDGYNILRGTAKLTNRGYLLTFPGMQSIGIEGYSFIGYDKTDRSFSADANIEFLVSLDLKTLITPMLGILDETSNEVIFMEGEEVIYRTNYNLSPKKTAPVKPGSEKLQSTSNSELKKSLEKALPIHHSKIEAQP